MAEIQKKIMILGAGSNQIPLIEAAKKMGYYIIVCDMRSEINAYQMVDEHIEANYMERERVFRIAKEKRIDGIISNSEPAMLNVAYVSQMLELPGNSVESVETLLSKDKFRTLQKKAGVYSPEHFMVSSFEELLEKAARMKYPLIVKPAECSGTRGTTKMLEYDEKNLRLSYEICRKFSRNQLVTVEEYVEMDLLRVNDADVFVIGNEIMWDGLLWEDRSADEPMLPMTEIFPMVLADKDLELMKDTVNKVIRASGITLGELNVETYFTTEHEVFVIEINPRQAGNYIPQLIKEHTGLDLTRLLVSTAVNDMSYYEELKGFERENNFITCQVVFAKEDGIYRGLCISSEIKQYVQWIKEEATIGDSVVRGINAANALAFVTLKFDTYENQHRFTDEIQRYVFAIVEPK